MYCKNCGHQLEEKWKYCPNCNTFIDPKSNENLETANNQDVNGAENRQNIELVKEQQKNTINNKKDNSNIYIIIFLISIGSSIFIDEISGIGFVIALITIVTGFIKHPKNRAIKVLFWLFLGYLLLMTILLVWFFITCSNTCSSNIG